MNNNYLEKITKLSFLGLALLPLLKENVNSILIIICAILTLVYNIQTKEKRKVNTQLWILTLPFWMFFLHELLSLDNSFDRVLVHLPFLIFPIIFAYKPTYIDVGIKKRSLFIFQISVLLQCFIYIIYFLLNNSISKFFYVQNNIPFFREYVSENYFFEIHPTYFSSFLLVSFTVSLFLLIKGKKNIFAIINMAIMVFFIFLFSSRIIILTLLLTIIFAVIYLILQKGLKQGVLVLISSVVLLAVLIYPAKDFIGKRFTEIKTEINKPIVGDYYNSTNTRIAILKCSFILLKDAPLFGYGDNLQEKLNVCYQENNDSNFYLKQTFNTHNYYINLITYGGWVFLVLFIGYLFYVYKKINYSILGLFLFIQFLIINVTENYFSRHYGIVLFAYITAMFIFTEEKETT
jgi:O-antigen ligase